MKSTGARRPARPTLGASRRWTTAGCATAQWKARSARRYPPPLQPPLTNQAFYSPNPCLLDRSLRSNHHRFDPRKQTPGGRHQIGTPAGFKSESVAGFLLECAAGFVGIRIFALTVPEVRLSRSNPNQMQSVDLARCRCSGPQHQIVRLWSSALSARPCVDVGGSPRPDADPCVMTSAFARVGARSIPGPHRGGPGLVILADQ